MHTTIILCNSYVYVHVHLWICYSYSSCMDQTNPVKLGRLLINDNHYLVMIVGVIFYIYPFWRLIWHHGVFTNLSTNPIHFISSIIHLNLAWLCSNWWWQWILIDMHLVLAHDRHIHILVASPHDIFFPIWILFQVTILLHAQIPVRKV